MTGQSEAALLFHYLVVGSLLFTIGLTGFMTRRNIILMFLSTELMLQGVSLGLIGWGRFHDQWDGQMLVTFVIAIAACEAAIALVLVLMLSQYTGTLDIAAWQGARESGVDPYVDREVPEAVPDGIPSHWPILTPAGVRPERGPEQEAYRPHV